LAGVLHGYDVVGPCDAADAAAVRLDDRHRDGHHLVRRRGHHLELLLGLQIRHLQVY
jgi:hypothetical protein